ncbi:gluconokinase [Alkalihalobacillus trypoxylicola]|uniref:Gluconokinase n=1 Tax=Alkalihalobacillus trypoxylicola TaxID=519424 RepID=A0A161PBJ9_9BACI|nr:gluconokinase [Alkalihalobacillus trypoxylicola]
MTDSYMIGVDIGTTSTKAVLFNGNGSAINQATVEYPLFSTKVGMAEQDPKEIFRAVQYVMKKCQQIHSDQLITISFVSFSSAMHSLMAVDKEGEPLTRLITWADQRASSVMDSLEENEALQIYQRTGTPIHPMSPFIKLRWLKNEYPDMFQSADKFISIKEYIFYKLFGQYVIEYSMASTTGLFHLENRQWDDEALAVCEIDSSKLSRLVPTTYKLTSFHKQYEQALSLPAETPFYIGATDGVLSNLGVNAITPGVFALTIGTSGALRTVVRKPLTHNEGKSFCYTLVDDYWVIGGPVNNGGIVLRWVKEQLARDVAEEAVTLGVDPYDHLLQIASQSSPGANGLLFFPYLTGERAPLWDADARGSFVGLSLHHTKADMIRAVLEGITFNLYMVYETLEKHIDTPRCLQATGGFSRSPFWRQLVADIFGLEVLVPESYESSCLGAVILGQYGEGTLKSLHAVKEIVGTLHRHDPNQIKHEVYQKTYSLYKQMTNALQPTYKELAQWQKSL